MAGGWRAPLAQTAVNDATQIVAALIESGELEAKSEAVTEAIDFYADHIFSRLDEVKQRDDEAYDADGGGKTNAKRSAKTGGKKSSGGKRSSGKSSAPKTLEDALDTEVTFGAFEGTTLGVLVEIDASEAEEDFGYGDGEKDGRDYIRWLARSAKKESLLKAAQMVADENGIEYDE